MPRGTRTSPAEAPRGSHGGRGEIRRARCLEDCCEPRRVRQRPSAPRSTSPAPCFGSKSGSRANGATNSRSRPGKPACSRSRTVSGKRCQSRCPCARPAWATSGRCRNPSDVWRDVDRDGDSPHEPSGTTSTGSDHQATTGHLLCCRLSAAILATCGPGSAFRADIRRLERRDTRFGRLGLLPAQGGGLIRQGETRPTAHCLGARPWPVPIH